MLAAANSCNTGNPFFSFSPLLITEHSIAPEVCIFPERFKSPVFFFLAQHVAMFLLDQSELFFFSHSPKKEGKKKKKSATSCPR